MKLRFGLQRKLYKTANNIHKEGYPAVQVEPHVSYLSVPTVSDGMRIHDLWIPDNNVLVKADEEVLLKRKVVNPKWIKKVLKEYPPQVLLGSLLFPLAIPLILGERYNFENHDECVEATLKTAQNIAKKLEEHGVSVELSDLVGEIKAPVGEGYQDIVPSNPEIQGRTANISKRGSIENLSEENMVVKL